MEQRQDMTDSDLLPIDGRTARRTRNRASVLDAVLQLFAEGDLTPGVHEVAERSGVSLRSVYRYFTDVDDLIAAAIDRQVEAMAPLFEIPDPGRGPTGDRIHRFCERRVALFSEVRAVYRAAVIRSTDQARVCDSVRRSRAKLRCQIGTMFAPELEPLPPPEADVIGGMLDSLSQLETLEYLFEERGHDTASATEFLEASFARVLCPDRKG